MHDKLIVVVDCDTKSFLSIVETVRILLAAGCSVTCLQPLEVLLELEQWFCIAKLCPCSTSPRGVYQFKIIAETFDLLLKHKTEFSNGHGMLFTILLTANRIAGQYNRQQYIAGGLETCNMMMDGLGDMYRSLVLAGARLQQGSAAHTISPFISTHCFTAQFINIAVYSSKSDRSQRLFNIIMISLGAKQVNDLRNRFVDKDFLEYFNRDPLSTHPDIAIKLICSVTPHRLQYLARSAILSAISPRNLQSSASSLGLPKILEEYVVKLI